jgi:hypothetical protein
MKTNFNRKTILVGIDVQKESWNLSIFLEGQLHRNVHHKPKFKDLSSYLPKVSEYIKVLIIKYLKFRKNYKMLNIGILKVF